MTVKRRSLVVAVVSAVLVLLLTMAAAERQSPGPVSSVHARIAELDGGEACSTCHGGWFSDMQTACNKCHEDIRKQLEDQHGLHGTFEPSLAETCSTCHSEHLGDEFQLVNRLAFAQAGVRDPQQFDHGLVGLVLAGAHVDLDCTACHEHAEATLLPEGEQRYLGLSRDCASCHADPHGGRMQLSCAVCHGQDTFAERIVADHESWLSLDGSHSAVDCRQCHVPGTSQALESLQLGSNRDGRHCGDCHAAPHGDGFLRGNAASDEVTVVGGCVSCHYLVHESFADPDVMLTPEQHAHSGFALAAPHDVVACQQCHAAEVSYAERHTQRQQRDCRSCHEDPHQGQFDVGPFAVEGCVGCHKDTHFVPHAFDLAHHERTALPLAGQHREQECSQCHVDPAEGVARQFRGTPSRCEQCHQDAHDGSFMHMQVVFDAEPRGACAECHDTEAWSHLDHQLFDHSDWTGFRLDGAHGQIDCTDCHARTAEPDQYGRRFGRIAAHQQGQAVCVTCHGDPHEGVFDRKDVPAVVDGRRGCQRCHDTASFRALPHGFDHGAFAQFTLRGRHGELDCSACHQRLSATSDTGRTADKAKGRICSDCHQDPHSGQFVRRGRTDCARCHKSATTFATLSFRHNLDSRFKLEEQHKKLKCGSCHKQEKTDQGVTLVRYKPLPTKCVDCHGREEGGSPFRRRRKR